MESLLTDFHALSLLHFPPLQYAPAFSTPAFSAPPTTVLECNEFGESRGVKMHLFDTKCTEAALKATCFRSQIHFTWSQKTYEPHAPTQLQLSASQ